jgi:uncharacterized protein VirK/YbjX
MNKQLGSLRNPSKWFQTVGLAWRALTHLGSLFRVMNFLDAPVFIDAFQDNPKMAYKYLTDSYLFHGLPVRDRADCFLHNHTLIQERFPLPMLRQFLTWGVDLVDITKNDVRFTVRCGLSRPCGKEGEQSLVLLADGMLLYSIAFTIVPGYVTRSKAREVILVSRIQGEPALSAETLKRAQKALSKLRFGSLLMAGLEGIALELGIEEVVCVSSVLQLSYAPAFADRFRHAYEDLFDERGFVQNEAGLYASPVPMKERAPGTGKGNMGDRERVRHWFRQQVCAACRDYLHHTLLPVSLRAGADMTKTAPAPPDPSTCVHAEKTELPRETSSLSFG